MIPLPLVLLLLGPLLPQSKPPAPPPELAAVVQYSPPGDLCGPWQTYVVELDSRATRDLDVVVRIEDDSFLSISTRRERLSPGARKRLFLYGAAASYQRGVPARYRISDAKGVELASGTLPNASRGIAPQAYQVGLLARIPAAEDDFGIPTSVNGNELRCGRFSVATMPDRWIGLAGLDLLIVHDLPFDELTADQTRALHDYVRLGGSVLFIPGVTPGWFQHPAIQGLAAVRTARPKDVPSLPGLNAIYGEFRAAGSFLAQEIQGGAEALPRVSSSELAEFPCGFGRVLVSSADLRRAPFDTWAGRRQFWSDLVQRVPRWFQDENRSFPMASNLQQREDVFLRMGRLINPYPPIGLIFGLAVVFLGIVGPVNYMVLWKLKRTLLLVITVPGISLGFLALIVVLGYALKGTSTVAHSVRLLETRSGLDVARETHLYSLFSPSTRTYDVSFEAGSHGPFDRWNAGDRQYYRRRSESMSTLTIDTGAAMSIKGVSTGQWQSWELETRALRPLGKGVRYSLEGGKLILSNGSTRRIERGILVRTGPEGGVSEFGAVDAGGMLTAPLVQGRPASADGLAMLSDPLGNALLRPWLESLIGPYYGDAGASRGQTYLVCVLKDEGTPVSVDAVLSGRSRSLTLLHVAEGP